MVVYICATIPQKGPREPRTVVPTWVLEPVPKDNEGQLCIAVYCFPRVSVEH